MRCSESATTPGGPASCAVGIRHPPNGRNPPWCAVGVGVMPVFIFGAWNRGCVVRCPCLCVVRSPFSKSVDSGLTLSQVHVHVMCRRYLVRTGRRRDAESCSETLLNTLETLATGRRILPDRYATRSLKKPHSNTYHPGTKRIKPSRFLL